MRTLDADALIEQIESYIEGAKKTMKGKDTPKEVQSTLGMNIMLLTNLCADIDDLAVDDEEVEENVLECNFESNAKAICKILNADKNGQAITELSCTFEQNGD